jgi:hypothetical protein
MTLQSEQLQNHCYTFLGHLLNLELEFQLDESAYLLLRDRLSHACREDGFVVHLEPDTSHRIEAVGPLLDETQLLRQVIAMRHTHPARNSIYLLIMRSEQWLADLVNDSTRQTNVGALVSKAKTELGLDVRQLRDFSRCREVQETRNAWMHNGGKADERYINECQCEARAPVGGLLPLHRDYFFSAVASFRGLVTEASEFLSRRYPPVRPVDPTKTLRTILGV